MAWLGYVSLEGRGAADRLLADVAGTLRDEGVRLGGAVQVNIDGAATRRCDMELHILSGHEVIRISQNLGREARGCQLDPDGLERMVGLVEAALDDATELLILNKFGKQEAEGRGFRPLIGQALVAGTPVLTAVSHANRPAFQAFSDGLAREVPPEPGAVLAWCRRALAENRIGARTAGT